MHTLHELTTNGPSPTNGAGLLYLLALATLLATRKGWQR